MIFFKSIKLAIFYENKKAGSFQFFISISSFQFKEEEKKLAH
jgi:hypothetical protein